MLHNALVALALGFLNDRKLRDIKTRQYFAQKAKSFLEAACQKPNISVIQALSLLGSFHSSQGDQNLGYLYFGTFFDKWEPIPYTCSSFDVDRSECPSFSSS
jgi:hypothetical protein